MHAYKIRYYEILAAEHVSRNACLKKKLQCCYKLAAIHTICTISWTIMAHTSSDSLNQRQMCLPVLVLLAKHLNATNTNSILCFKLTRVLALEYYIPLNVAPHSR